MNRNFSAAAVIATVVAMVVFLLAQTLGTAAADTDNTVESGQAMSSHSLSVTTAFSISGAGGTTD